ncbi:unnamed protein product [Cyclocybe aegerita]|uniref:Uncharacterized protein n=1 Tax=Cyclocybe aegerita TaxID=1973307 RepID=A0A8S0W0N7_CYCAE|nr:unnamed protein product [Cyclocybe aegerita]
MSTSDDSTSDWNFEVKALYELHMLGALIAGVAYGVVIVISLDCFRMVWRNETRIRTFTLIYIVAMTAVSSVSFMLGVVTFVNSIFRFNTSWFDMFGIFGLDALLFPLALWGADGFMMYRCIMLYQGVPRAWRIILHSLLGLLSCLLLVSGIMFPVVSFSPTKFFLVDILANPFFITLLLVSLTSFVNLALAALVTVRLHYHQRNTRKILGTEYGSPYSRTIAICIESCALIIVVDLAFIVLFLLNSDTSVIPGQLLVQASILSPFLIISRVARRTDVLSTMRTQLNIHERQLQLEEGGRLETLRFIFSHASEGKEHSTEYIPPNGTQLSD